MEDLDKKTPELARYGESTNDTDDSADEADDDTGSDSKQEKSTDRNWFGKDKDNADKDEEFSLYDLFEQHAEPEPPLEDLATDEKVLVAEEATELNLDAANQELVGTEPGSPEEAAAIAGATFNEAVKERLDNGEAPSEDTLDAAMEDTADILGFEATDIPDEDPVDLDEPEESEQPEAVDPLPVENEALPPDETPDDAEADIDTPEATPDEPVAAPEDDAEDTTDPPDPVTPPPTPPPPAGGAGAGAPPPPGGGAGGPGGPGGPTGSGPGGGGFVFGPGVAPIPIGATAPWMAPGVATALATGNALRHGRRHRHWPYVLAGGVVGYLIGRRRGRIKTEKKLKPIQQRLETQVGDLQFQLALREAKIRKLAYEKAISHPHIHAALPKRLKELQELQKANLKKADFERTDMRGLTKESVKRANRGEKIMTAGLAEKIIRMTERERRTDNPTDAVAAAGEKPRSRTELTSAKDMALADLLTIAEQIPVEDHSLRVLYRTGRISQHGLRRVIEAYLRGERFDRVLFEELKRGDGVEKSLTIETATDSILPAPVNSPVANTQVSEPPDLSTNMNAADPLLKHARSDYYEQLTGAADSDSHDASFPWVTVAVIGGIIGIVLIVLLYLA
ncbi:hypothetical protein E6P97_04470 [Patescibacteria group bacterium]|nr:MAG: hypothetical protein E6P97_04470 [Patescibacteria group bacterium]